MNNLELSYKISSVKLEHKNIHYITQKIKNGFVYYSGDRGNFLKSFDGKTARVYRLTKYRRKRATETYPGRKAHWEAEVFDIPSHVVVALGVKFFQKTRHFVIH